MEYKFRYAPTATGGPGKRGRNPDPNNWQTGPDPIQHDKHYAYLKHKAQAKYRGEDYSLTQAEWFELWTDELWLQRGRGTHNLCLQQREALLGWHWDTVEIVTRQEHFAQLKKRNRDAQS